MGIPLIVKKKNSCVCHQLMLKKIACMEKDPNPIGDDCH